MPVPPVRRRRTDQYPLDRSIRYQTLDSRRVEGTGRTIDMSSRGVLFTTENTLNPGQEVEVSISQPAEPNYKLPLTPEATGALVATGKVVWCKDGRAAIEITRYEFRLEGEGAGK